MVIDSVNFPQEVRSVSEMTFDLLSERTMHSHKIPLLLACNKQDIALARRCSNIQKELEKEMYEDIALHAQPSTKERPALFLGYYGVWLHIWSVRVGVCVQAPNINISLVPRLGLLWGVASHPEGKSWGVCSVLYAICRHIEYLPLVPKKDKKKKKNLLLSK